MLLAKLRRDQTFLAYRKGGVVSVLAVNGEELKEQSFAGGPRAGQLDRRSQLCFLAKVIFSGPGQGKHLRSPNLGQRKLRAALAGGRALSCQDVSTTFPSFGPRLLGWKQPFPRAWLLLLPLAH